MVSVKKKKQDKVIKRLAKAFNSGDARFMMVEKKLRINKNKTYKDIIK
jgi:hypothetical protein